MRKTEKILILAGTLLIACACVLLLYNVWDGHRAAEASAREVKEVDKVITDSSNADDATVAKAEKDTVSVDGHRYIGIIRIPSLDLTLPVMNRWSYKNLRISPCLYSGSYETDDLVICGHNYLRHFGPLKTIAEGTDIYFETIDGQEIHYTVKKRETVKPTAIDQMISKDGTDDWDMTLFTCNTGGQTRCAVRCVRTESSR